jgi:hypothetical protein
MPNFRMLSLRAEPITANAHGCTGRVYRVPLGEMADVPAADVQMLGANGFLLVAGDAPVGPTADRPRSRPNIVQPGAPPIFGEQLRIGQRYLDTDVRALVVWTGKAWVDVLTGKGV